MRCQGSYARCVNALYMNNSTYVCLIRRGLTGGPKVCIHTCTYVFVRERRGGIVRRAWIRGSIVPRER